METLENSTHIAEQYQKVLEKIAETAARVGRRANEVKLVVVTKGHTIEMIKQVIGAGAKRLGENYAEEAVEKINQLRDYSGVEKVEWHMIGHVQSRKAETVVQYFDFIHSLDSLKLAQRYERFADQFNKQLPVLLEMNVSGEESKFGFPAWDKSGWDKLLKDIEEIISKPHLTVCGLMTMAPYFENAEKTRPIFRRLVELRSYLKQVFPEIAWNELSMGMSSDFEVAIEEGATIVRIGQAILGPRKTT